MMTDLVIVLGISSGHPVVYERSEYFYTTLTLPSLLSNISLQSTDQKLKLVTKFLNNIYILGLGLENKFITAFVI